MAEPLGTSGMAGLYVWAGEGCSRLRVRVTPKASRNGVLGVVEGALRLRIQAPPADGAANEKTREFLAELLGCPRGAVRLERGQSHREKIFRIEGMVTQAVLAALAPFLPDP